MSRLRLSDELSLISSGIFRTAAAHSFERCDAVGCMKAVLTAGHCRMSIREPEGVDLKHRTRPRSSLFYLENIPFAGVGISRSFREPYAFKKRSCYITYNGYQDLFIPSLMFCLFKKFFVFVLTHLLLTPFYNVPHGLTSFALCFCILLPDP